MQDKPLTLALAEHLSRVNVERTTAAGLQMAVSAIIDTVAVTLAGAPEASVSILRRTLGGPAASGPSLIFGDHRRTDVLNAALVNGTAAHAIDYDDMAAAMGGHPSVPVVPVVFALGEQLQVSGRQALDAYIVGFEAECRIGRAVHPHHYSAGWHPTSTLGVFGAAAAAARLLELDVEKTAMALALCASMASGVKANFGTMTKPLHVGRCAHDGLMAAMLVREGFTAKLNALEQKEGFFAAFDGLANVHPDRMLANLDGALEIEQPEIGLKQFPCCGSTHPSILAMMQLRRDGLTSAQVEAIDIRTHKKRLPHTDNPRPQTPLGAKFSIQYVTARALVDGAPRLHHFEGEAFLEPEIQRLLARTTASALPDGEDTRADQFTAEVSVVTRDGRRLSARLPAGLGRGPADPMSREELWTKFHDCGSQVLTDAASAKAFDALAGIETAARLSDITDLLAHAQLPGGAAADVPARAPAFA